MHPGHKNGHRKPVIPADNHALSDDSHVIPADAGIQKGRAAGSDKNPQLDVEAARKSLTRMANIFADIAKHAEESTLTRCPYKDAKSRCTAKFGCSNQHFTKNPLDQPICTAKDGDLDYRSAWEID